MDSEMPTTRRQQISNETLRRMSGTHREWRRVGPICAVFAGVVGGLLAIAWVLNP